MALKADSQLSLLAMAGAGGQIDLTNADSPFDYPGLITGGKTDDVTVTLTGTQYNKENNNLLPAFEDREFASDGLFDAVWSIRNTIVIPVDTTIRIYVA